MLQKRSHNTQPVNLLGESSPAQRLAVEVRRALEACPSDAATKTIQVSVPIAEIDPLHWMQNQRYTTQFFWESREGTAFVAGVGEADVIHENEDPGLDFLSKKAAARLAVAGPSIRYFGGMRFDRMSEYDQNWDRFGVYRFILPRFELQRNGVETRLACNLVLPEDLDSRNRILRETEALTIPIHSLSGDLPMPLSRQDLPEEQTWQRMVKEALFRQNGQADLEKVVLARQVIFQFSDAVPRHLLFNLLRKATPHCFHFYCQFSEENAFLGASPERLYRRRSRRVESEAVAGTGRRGQADDTDTQLGHALLLSDKDQREHAFVRDSIKDSFESLCETMDIEQEASLLNLSMGRHLRSKFQGVLDKDISDIEILKRLPPTAAVGGHPKGKSLRRIQDLEPFDRGWYAGPIGWLSRDAAEFAVAIRSGLVSDHALTLFSGAGIVEGSEPESEWAEIEQKIGDFIRVLGLDQRSAKY